MKWLVVGTVAWLLAWWLGTFWWGGPQVLPGVVTVASLLALAAYGLWRRRRRVDARVRLSRALAEQAEALETHARAERAPELRALGAELARALTALRGSKLAHGRAGALYGLPWLLVLGASRAGKTEAIRASGLSFPLETGPEHAQRAGIGCRFRLADRAVLLDSAGRLLDGDDARDEWLGLLELLRRARSRRPLDGLVLAIDVVDLLAADEQARAAFARRVRARLEELVLRLGIRPPVHVLLTRCDRLSGFVESFADLPRAERSQVLGFALAQDGPAAGIAERWARLVQVIERRAVQRVGEDCDLAVRRAAHGLTSRLEALGEAVDALLTGVFTEHAYRECPRLCGVYLSSALQQGESADDESARLAQTFGLSAPPVGSREGRRSFFLGQLFRQVLPSEGRVVRGAQATRRRTQLRNGSLALALLAALSLAWISARAVASGRVLIADVRTELSAGRAARASGALAALAPLRARTLALDAEQGSLDAALGLQPASALRTRVRESYQRVLRDLLIAPLVGALERSLATQASASFEDLRSYLLLTRPRAEGEPALAGSAREALRARLVAQWALQQSPPPSLAERAQAGDHLAAYLSMLERDSSLALARSSAVVSAARAALRARSPGEHALDALVASVDAHGLSLSIEQLLGASGLPLQARGRVPGAFTRRGWEEYVRPWLEHAPEALMQAAWVTGEADDASRCALRARYFARYLDAWRGFLGTLRMEQPLDSERALSQLQDLTRGQPPPLSRLMRAVADNAVLREATPATAEPSTLLDGLRRKVAGDRTDVEAPQPACPGSRFDALDVRRGLHGFFSFGASTDATADAPTGGASQPQTALHAYQEQLSYLRDALQAASEDPGQGEALVARLASARTRVRALIESQEIGWRPRFELLLWPAIEGCSVSASSALAKERGRGWCNSVVTPWASSLRDRYPFAPGGQDAALDDVASFYRPLKGTLWSFYESALAREVPRLGARFEPREGPGAGSQLSPEIPRFLERAQALTQALFPPQADAPRVETELRVRPAPGIAQVVLTLDGQRVDFHNGPERWVRVSWPGDGAQRGASLRVRGENVDETVLQEGEWGWFRLLEQGSVSAQPGERFFTVRFRLHTQHDVVIDVRPSRAEHPLLGPRGMLDVFRGPGSTVPRTLTARAQPCRD